MKLSELQTLTNKLATELGLTQEGWQITVQTKRKLKNLAQTSWEPSRRSGIIVLRTQKAIYEDTKALPKLFPYAVAYTILHELLHVRLEGHTEIADIEETTYRLPAFEWALDKLAETLVLGFVSRGIIHKERRR